MSSSMRSLRNSCFIALSKPAVGYFGSPTFFSSTPGSKSIQLRVCEYLPEPPFDGPLKNLTKAQMNKAISSTAGMIISISRNLPKVKNSPPPPDWQQRVRCGLGPESAPFTETLPSALHPARTEPVSVHTPCPRGIAASRIRFFPRTHFGAVSRARRDAWERPLSCPDIRASQNT